MPSNVGKGSIESASAVHDGRAAPDRTFQQLDLSSVLQPNGKMNDDERLNFGTKHHAVERGNNAIGTPIAQRKMLQKDLSSVLRLQKRTTTSVRDGPRSHTIGRGNQVEIPTNSKCSRENNSRIIEAKMQLQQAGLNIVPEEYLDRHEPRRSDLKTESQKEKLVFIDEDGIIFSSNEKGELCLAGIVDESNENV